MRLRALIEDYRACECRLVAAIECENHSVVQELDARMVLLRKAIHDFRATTPGHKRQQVGFFLDMVAKTTDLGSEFAPLRELHDVTGRALGMAGDNDDVASMAGTAGPAAAAWPHHEVLSIIERSTLRIAMIDREARYVYVSNAYARFHDRSAEAMAGRHLSEIVGSDHYESHARDHVERCFSGEDVCYFHTVPIDGRSRMLLECLVPERTSSQAGIRHAIIVQRDLTDMSRDLVRAAASASA